MCSHFILYLQRLRLNEIERMRRIRILRWFQSITEIDHVHHHTLNTRLNDTTVHVIEMTHVIEIIVHIANYIAHMAALVLVRLLGRAQPYWLVPGRGPAHLYSHIHAHAPTHTNAYTHVRHTHNIVDLKTLWRN